MSQEFSCESIADIAEGKLVEKLLADPHYRYQRLLNIYGIPKDTEVYPEVNHNDLGNPGDIDILVVNPVKPEFATAIQVKRIKVVKKTFETNSPPNKLEALKELHWQANKLVDFGFWQVFSYALVVIDSRSNNKGKLCFDGLKNNVRLKLENPLMDSMNHLKDTAGFFCFELTQPMDFLPLTTGTFFSRSFRMPTPRQQPDNLTQWVSGVVTSKTILN